MNNTKGPWRISKRLRGVVEDQNGVVIATMSGAVDGSPTANAALTASSPVMFGVLQDIELALKSGNLKKPNQWRERISVILRGIQEAAQA